MKILLQRAFHAPYTRWELSLLITVLLFQSALADPGDGNNGLNEANTLVRGYFTTGTQLMYGVASIMGLLGAIRVFSIMQSSEHRTVGKDMFIWLGSCIFLCVVSQVLKSFFGN